MPSRFRAHKIWAILVLIAAGGWVATGHFASVGSETALAAQPSPTAAEGEAKADPAAKDLRTVAATVPEFADHAREIRLSGVTGADKRAELAARASGVISALPIEQGDEVGADDVVMTIEGADLGAAVTTAEAQLEQRTQELAVAEKLFKSGNTAELQLIKVRAEKAAAESALSQARAAADRLNLRAPFAGVIDSVDVDLGEWVQVGAPIATLLSLSPIVVRAEVGELDVGFVNIGDRARVRLINGAELEGTVSHIARDATTQTRTFPIEVELADPAHAVPFGMTAEVSLYTKPERAVSIPRSVITLSADGRIGVRIVGADDIAQFVPVNMIDDTATSLVITGVPEDVRIIVAGQDLVSDGEKVIVKEVTLPIVRK